MAGVNIAAIDDILKLDYQGPIREQLQNTNVLLAHIRKDTSRNSFQGKEAVIPVHTGRNIGRGFRAESEVLPAAGKQSYNQAKFHMSYLYGRIALTGQSISVSRNDRGSFARALDLEMKGLQTDMKRTLQRVTWGDGTGMLTGLRNGAGNENSTTASNKVLAVNSTRWCEVGQEVFVVRADDFTTGERLIASGDTTTPYSTIDSIDELNRTITLNTWGTNCAAHDADGRTAVFLRGSRNHGATQRGYNAITELSAGTQEMWGVRSVCSNFNPGVYPDKAAAGFSNNTTIGDNLGHLNHLQPTTDTDHEGNFGELNRAHSGNSYWRANTVHPGAVNETGNFEILQEAYDNTEIESGSKPGLMLTSHLIRRKIGSLLQKERRFDTLDHSQHFNAGWSGISFGNSVIIADKDASNPFDPRNDVTWTAGEGVAAATSYASGYPFADVFLLDLPSWEWVVMEDLAWEDTGGVIIRSGVGADAVDAYEAYMKAYWNVACALPHNNCVLRGYQFA
jgi:hypothetical protein